MITISQAKAEWLGSVGASRSQATYKTYKTAAAIFEQMLSAEKIKMSAGVDKLSERHVGKFALFLKDGSIAREQCYMTAINRFYHFLCAEEYASFNMEKVADLIHSRSRRARMRAPEFPMMEIQRVLKDLGTLPRPASKAGALRLLRDIALILTLADTGLRIHEACNLKRGDLAADRSAVVIGKGDKQAKIFFTRRSARAINQYLRARLEFDGQTGRPLSSLPLFARHDKAIGRKIEKITPQAGRDIIDKRVAQILGDNLSGITPHKFRHAFVTAIMQKSGGNLKLAQELARHSNIQVTQRYAHLSNQDLQIGHRKVFEDG